MPWQNKRVLAIACTVFVLVSAFLSVFFIATKDGWINNVGTLYFYAFALLIAFGMFVFTKGITGLRRVFQNLRLTQSADIFHYVKKRQE